MKSLYDIKGLQTAESQQLGVEIERAIEPVLKKYLDKGFSMRDLSHEAQSVIRDWELDRAMDIHMENANRAKESLEKKKVNSETQKKFGLARSDWDYGVDYKYEMPGGC